MKKYFLIAALLSNSVILAEPVTYPGNPNHPEFGNKHYTGYSSPLLEDMFNLATIKINHWTKNREGETLETVRERIISRIKEHPEEVNDYGYQDGGGATPLSMAIMSNDIEIAKLLLENGAIPFPPVGCTFWKDTAPKESEYTEILQIVANAQKKSYPLFEIILKSDLYRKKQ